MGLKLINVGIISVNTFELKSDHFGIEIRMRRLLKLQQYPLKSDHFGIEIVYLPKDEKWLFWLKSDHFGIEMYLHLMHQFLSRIVKIRPFWD